MRALFTVHPSIGHLHPLVPVARALRDAGHDVAVCSSARFAPEVESFGLDHLPAGLDWHTSDRSTWGAFPPVPPPGPQFAAFVATMFADVASGRMARDLVEVARDWRADLVVRESMEYGGCLAAERLGIPHASVAGNGWSAVDDPSAPYFPGNRRLVAGPLARHRQALGLAPDPGVLMPFRHLHLCFTPPEWDGAQAPRPDNARFLRHASALPTGARLPGWASALPHRPTVLASLGTVFNRTPGVLEDIIAGLRDHDLNLIVAVGRDQDPARFGAQPEHVRLEAHVPQPLLLPRCDALVTHGGFNSVKEALGAGVPMVVVPIAADQPYCARRCAALGVGRAIAPQERSAQAIGAAVAEVLGDAGYAERARAFRARMERLPGIEHAIELLEALPARAPAAG